MTEESESTGKDSKRDFVCALGRSLNWDETIVDPAKQTRINERVTHSSVSSLQIPTVNKTNKDKKKMNFIRSKHWSSFPTQLVLDISCICLNVASLVVMICLSKSDLWKQDLLICLIWIAFHVLTIENKNNLTFHFPTDGQRLDYNVESIKDGDETESESEEKQTD